MNPAEAARPPIRLARTLLLLAVAVGLGVGGHASAGGQGSLLVALIAAVIAAPLAWQATARQRSAAMIAGLLALVQLIVHGAAALVVVPGATDAHAAHLGHHGIEQGSGVAMLATHAGTTALSVLWLVLVERRAWKLARRALHRLARTRGAQPCALVATSLAPRAPQPGRERARPVRAGDALAFRGPPRQAPHTSRC